MINTKKLLSLGVALAIALCASVQMFATNETQQVNPHLSRQDKEFLHYNILEHTAHLKDITDPKSSLFLQNASIRNDEVKTIEKDINNLKQIYYGNRPYTQEEMRAIIEQ